MDLEKAIRAASNMKGYEAKIKGASKETTYTQVNGLFKPIRF